MCARVLKDVEVWIKSYKHHQSIYVCVMLLQLDPHFYFGALLLGQLSLCRGCTGLVARWLTSHVWPMTVQKMQGHNHVLSDVPGSSEAISESRGGCVLVRPTARRQHVLTSCKLQDILHNILLYPLSNWVLRNLSFCLSRWCLLWL